MQRRIRLGSLVGLVVLLMGSITAQAAPSRRLNPGDGITSDGQIVSSTQLREGLPLPSDGQIDRVIGTEDRVRVTNTTTTPYVGIVYFTGTGCTGFFYKNNTVATAGHCVYSNGAWLNVGNMVPAKDGPNEPLGQCRVTNLLALLEWVNNSNWDYDVGAVKVDCTGTPSMNLTVASDATLSGLFVNLTGYPGEKGGEMWTGSGTITSITPNTILL